MLAIRLADQAGVQGKAAVPDLARAIVAALTLFAVTGWGLTRLLLPDGLRRYELLWVAPVGACATGLSMTVLGFAAVPYRINLGLVIAGGVVLAVVAWRRPRSALPPAAAPSAKDEAGAAAAQDPPADAAAHTEADRDLRTRAAVRRIAWPAWIALLLIAISLIPLLRAGFATVEGQGQDAHLAVGSAIFLQHNYPTGEDIALPVDRMPLVWRSKQAIYYNLAAVASLSGLEVYQTISALAAVLLALAAIGFYLFIRDVLRAPVWAAVVGMTLIGLDRMVLHTVMHPYFNQTWGFFGLGFACVLSWWAVKERTRGGIALLIAFLAMITLAYPLALPIPLIPLAIVLWPELKRVRPKGIWKGKRSLRWMIPVGFLFLASLNVPPIKGVSEKFSTAMSVVLNPSHSLQNWGGDLKGYFIEPQFIAINTFAGLALMIVPLVYAIHLCLRDLDRPMRRGLTALLAFTIAFALWFRLREYGYYFHFKLLAFVGPVALALAAAGAAKVRPARTGIIGVAVLLTMAMSAAAHEIGSTFDELPKNVLQLQDIDAALPPGQSVRLDIDPQEQNWVAFMMHGQPLCSQKPLLGTNYPHVQTSRKAQFILVRRDAPRPADAVGGPVQQIETFLLYRMRADVPGVDRCSQAMVETVSKDDFKGP
ncbi:hypothetical protein DSM112329_04978 [Paraconexibacter sp. AEG42_29]|uniref:Glycosyltransferase RgtA/B/C/D-like domain-containing protein n=1 Tax=Paraconexibacter sp. AEG42_29 TaxID=2997339 RepID=A0AAU7B244_9ACTN